MNESWVWLIQGGTLSVLATVFGMLHRSSINAYRYVAEKAWLAATEERRAHDTTREQLYQVLAPLRKSARP